MNQQIKDSIARGNVTVSEEAINAADKFITEHNCTCKLQDSISYDAYLYHLVKAITKPDEQLADLAENQAELIEGMYQALYRLRHEVFYGGEDEINNIMDDALKQARDMGYGGTE